MIQAVSWVAKIMGHSTFPWGQRPPGEREHLYGKFTQAGLFFFYTHLEESQTSPTSQGPKLVSMISQILSRACGQCSTSTSF